MYRIDSHQHFWKYDPLEYDWIDDEMRAIRRDFLPDDLRSEITLAGIDAVISVQARQTLAETFWLLELANRHDFIRGVVGWAPLTDSNVEESLERISADPKLRAIRHILQSEPDPFYILRDDFNRGIRILKQFELAYDVLIFERHLPQTIEFVDRHSNQLFIVDHLAKPRVKSREISPWRENIQELAKRPHVYCKISGLVTEGDYSGWTPEQLRPYIETVFEAFGTQRVMFGSDWPVCLVAISYRRWVLTVEEALKGFSESEQERFWSRTAEEAYGLRHP